MQHDAKSIRPFVGSKDFEISRRFYTDLGFEEITISTNMSLFRSGDFGFYLQDAYVKDWIDNTMVFMEVADVNKFFADLTALNLPDRFESARVLPVREEQWGRECFVIDPSGVLWHFGEFFTT